MSADLVNIREDEIERHENIGRGGFGTVLRGTWKGNFVAIKRIDKLSPGDDDVEKEAKTCQRLDHKNVVRFFGIVKSEFKGNTIIELVFEFVEHGSLYDVLRRDGIQDQKRYEEYAAAWTMDVAKAVEYLQTEGIQHRDIKSQNFLVSSNYTLKICDFGFAKYSRHTEGHSKGCTAQYAAPEIFTKEVYSPRSDIYSVGVVILEIVTKKKPYDGLEINAVKYKTGSGKKLPVPLTIPPKVRDILEQCFETDREMRPEIHRLIVVLGEEAQSITGMP